MGLANFLSRLGFGVLIGGAGVLLHILSIPAVAKNATLLLGGGGAAMNMLIGMSPVAWLLVGAGGLHAFGTGAIRPVGLVVLAVAVMSLSTRAAEHVYEAEVRNPTLVADPALDETVPPFVDKQALKRKAFAENLQGLKELTEARISAFGKAQ